MLHTSRLIQPSKKNSHGHGKNNHSSHGKGQSIFNSFYEIQRPTSQSMPLRRSQSANSSPRHVDDDDDDDSEEDSDSDISETTNQKMNRLQGVNSRSQQLQLTHSPSRRLGLWNSMSCASNSATIDAVVPPNIPLHRPEKPQDKKKINRLETPNTVTNDDDDDIENSAAVEDRTDVIFEALTSPPTGPKARHGGAPHLSSSSAASVASMKPQASNNRNSNLVSSSGSVNLSSMSTHNSLMFPGQVRSPDAANANSLASQLLALQQLQIQQLQLQLQQQQQLNQQNQNRFPNNTSTSTITSSSPLPPPLPPAAAAVSALPISTTPNTSNNGLPWSNDAFSVAGQSSTTANSFHMPVGSNGHMLRSGSGGNLLSPAVLMSPLPMLSGHALLNMNLSPPPPPLPVSHGTTPLSNLMTADTSNNNVHSSGGLDPVVTRLLSATGPISSSLPVSSASSASSASSSIAGTNNGLVGNILQRQQEQYLATEAAALEHFAQENAKRKQQQQQQQQLLQSGNVHSTSLSSIGSVNGSATNSLLPSHMVQMDTHPAAPVHSNIAVSRNNSNHSLLPMHLAPPSRQQTIISELADYDLTESPIRSRPAPLQTSEEHLSPYYADNVSPGNTTITSYPPLPSSSINNNNNATPAAHNQHMLPTSHAGAAASSHSHYHPQVPAPSLQHLYHPHLGLSAQQLSAGRTTPSAGSHNAAVLSPAVLLSTATTAGVTSASSAVSSSSSSMVGSKNKKKKNGDDEEDDFEQAIIASLELETQRLQRELADSQAMQSALRASMGVPSSSKYAGKLQSSTHSESTSSEQLPPPPAYEDVVQPHHPSLSSSLAGTSTAASSASQHHRRTPSASSATALLPPPPPYSAAVGSHNTSHTHHHNHIITTTTTTTASSNNSNSQSMATRSLPPPPSYEMAMAHQQTQMLSAVGSKHQGHRRSHSHSEAFVSSSSTSAAVSPLPPTDHRYVQAKTAASTTVMAAASSAKHYKHHPHQSHNQQSGLVGLKYEVNEEEDDDDSSWNGDDALEFHGHRRSKSHQRKSSHHYQSQPPPPQQYQNRHIRHKRAQSASVAGSTSFSNSNDYFDSLQNQEFSQPLHHLSLISSSSSPPASNSNSNSPGKSLRRTRSQRMEQMIKQAEWEAQQRAERREFKQRMRQEQKRLQKQQQQQCSQSSLSSPASVVIPTTTSTNIPQQDGYRLLHNPQEQEQQVSSHVNRPLPPPPPPLPLPTPPAYSDSIAHTNRYNLNTSSSLPGYGKKEENDVAVQKPMSVKSAAAASSSSSSSSSSQANHVRFDFDDAFIAESIQRQTEKEAFLPPSSTVSSASTAVLPPPPAYAPLSSRAPMTRIYSLNRREDQISEDPPQKLDHQSSVMQPPPAYDEIEYSTTATTHTNNTTTNNDMKNTNCSIDYKKGHKKDGEAVNTSVPNLNTPPLTPTGRGHVAERYVRALSSKDLQIVRPVQKPTLLAESRI